MDADALAHLRAQHTDLTITEVPGGIEARLRPVLGADGLNPLEQVPAIRETERRGDLDAAIASLLHCCDALEADAATRSTPNWTIAPGYYERIAILYRKQKNHAAEVQILERYRRVQTDSGLLYKFDYRLRRARELLVKQQAKLTSP